MSDIKLNPRTIRASVVQTSSAQFSLKDTLVKLEALTRLARDRDGSQLCVFPEAFIGGYPKFSTFGATIGDRISTGRSEFARYREGAIELPPPNLSIFDRSEFPALASMESVSRETGIFLIVGVIERSSVREGKGNGGTLYCTAVFVDPERGYVGKHRKLMPTAAERLVWGQGDGSTLPVVEAMIKTVGKVENQADKDQREAQGDDQVSVRITATICWENYMPLLRTFYYSQGTQIYCAPTVDARTEWQSTMHHIALEGRCFVLSACQFATEKDYPSDHPFPSDYPRHPDNIVIAGGSVIISPLGKILAGPLRDAEGVLTAELDLNDIARGKFDVDVVGHYARDDIFQFHANVPSTNTIA